MADFSLLIFLLFFLEEQGLVLGLSSIRLPKRFDLGMCWEGGWEDEDEDCVPSKEILCIFVMLE